MRVKVESVPPLPHVKAWFSAHALASILHLKTSLCTDLHPLSHAHVRPDHILLLLDDFELLDSSPIDVLRDGDLIVVKKRPQTTSAKRKASSQVPSPAHKRTKTNDGRSLSRKSRPPAASAHATAKPHAHVAVESSSSSDSTSHSEDDSPSDTDSDSDSDSSDSESSSSSTSSTSGSTSSTSTSSTSSSDSASIPRTSKQAPNGAPPKPSKPAPPPVPPGLGKPATHSRNLRRRRKKMYERIAQTAEPASVNDIPLGTRARPLTSSPAPSAEPEQHPSQALVNGATNGKGNDKAKGKEPDRQHPAAAPAFMMASLQNKNKRRGFKNAMSLGVPPKIYFPDAPTAASTSSQAHPHSADLDPDAQLVEAALQVHPSPPAPASASASRPASRAQPRLVPPSEKQERGQIPANMFVTSVDVEEGLWPARRTKSSKKKKKKRAPVEEDAQWAYEEEDTFAAGLPYDDPPEAPAVVAPMSQSDGDAAQSTEHAVVAATWDTLRKIAEKSQVRPGATVGWKALGINFATLTPEMLLHVGRVIRSDDDQLVVEPFAEPSVEEVSFGGAVVAEDGAAVEETFEWPDVLSGDWRLVSAA